MSHVQNSVLVQKVNIFSAICFFLLTIIPSYFSLPILVFLLLNHFLLVSQFGLMDFRILIGPNLLSRPCDQLSLTCLGNIDRLKQIGGKKFGSQTDQLADYQSQSLTNQISARFCVFLFITTFQVFCSSQLVIKLYQWFIYQISSYQVVSLTSRNQSCNN